MTLETGERYRFGPTTIEQSALRPELVTRYLRFREGDWYNAEALLRTQFALDDSQYYSIVEVLPEERDRKNKIAPVRITAEPNRRHLYTIAAGYGTDTGARGTVGWEDRRFNTRGHRMRAELRASRIDTSAGITYIVPWTDPALEKLSYGLRIFSEQRADVETTGGTFKVGLTQVRGNWQRVLSVTLDHTEDKVTTHIGRLDARRPQSHRASRPGYHVRAPAAGFPGDQHRAARIPGRAARLDQRARLGHEFRARRRERRAAVQAGG